MKKNSYRWSAVFTLLFSIALLGFTEYEKNDPIFCVSCHLPSGQPLHKKKYENLIADKITSIAALHREEEIYCIGCHVPEGKVDWLKQKGKEVLNGFKYFTGNFKEPPNLSAPWVDGRCINCHKELGRGGPYHRASAHKEPFPLRCSLCHLSHESGGEEKNFFLHYKTLEVQCGKCHARENGKVKNSLKPFL